MRGGLCSYLRTIQPTLTAFIHGKLKLTLAQVNSFSSSAAIASFYFYDLIYTWLRELNSMLSNFSELERILTLVTFVLSLLVYVFLLEFWFIARF
jgi:hypothetical protein